MVEQNGKTQQYTKTQQLVTFGTQFGKSVLGDAAAVATYQQSEHLLILPGEASQLGVFD